MIFQGVMLCKESSMEDKKQYRVECIENAHFSDTITCLKHHYTQR